MPEALQMFCIVLDSADAAYTPGEKVTGVVVVRLRRAKCIQGLKIKFKGEAEVKWVVRKDDDGNVEWDERHEEYFRSEYYLFGGAGNTNILEIEEGHHGFPFKFSLPRNIPSSFVHTDGCVIYTIKAVWERSWSCDFATSTTMRVEAPYDLSQVPAAMKSIDDERNRRFCCFPLCFPMGSMRCNVYIPSSGFAAGETMIATFSINNGSKSVNVTAIRLELLQHVSLFGTKGKKVDHITVQIVEHQGPFDKREDEVVVPMKIESLPPSTFPHCGIISVAYDLAVAVCVSGCHCNLKKRYPLYIGTKSAVNAESSRNPAAIPVIAQTHTFRPMQTDAPSAPFFEDDDPTPLIEPIAPPARFVPHNQGQAFTTAEEDPPPSYDQCVGTSRENLLPRKK